MGEEIREALLLVVGGLGPGEIALHAAQRDEEGDARRHDQYNGEKGTAQVPDVAKELAVERSHRPPRDPSPLELSGRWRTGLEMISTILPLRNRTTRSAIPPIAALWVITATVVPISRWTFSRTSRTSFPVS